MQFQKPINVTFIITGLSTGGAEMMLVKLLSRIDRNRFSPSVITLCNRGSMAEWLDAIDVPVYALDIKPGRFSIVGLWDLLRLLQILKPNIIQGWMYHGNLAGQLAGLFSGKDISVLWNVRQSLYSLDHEKRGTSVVIKMGRYLSRFPECIIYNSKTSAEQHEAIGYRKDKRTVIPNGFDTDLFTPSHNSKMNIREELNIPNDVIIVGLIGRYHPMKDHSNFLQAASHLLKIHPGIHFVMAGNQVDDTNENLHKLINDLNISAQVHLLGERRDIPRLTAAMDIACSSSSHQEGFANVIGEAMACGVPCTVTDIGDSAWIVGETGKVVQPRDSEALARAWCELIDMGEEKRHNLGIKARQRVIDKFSLDHVVEQYENLYERIKEKDNKCAA